ncbi:MAG: glycoside hydrolase [Spirochaetes bacterium]|nr:glycoside hydrolase [Spirochaetota bacterium]
MKNLKETSIRIILENQAESGAYVACPTFPTYRYSWLRDGSFIGYSMLLYGEVVSCEKFLIWVNETILKKTSKVELLKEKLKAKVEITQKDFLPTRFTLDGEEVMDTWPNHQVDGYGAWLWLLSEFIERTGKTEYLSLFKESIDLTLAYLEITWNLPNYDCWEENGEGVHPSTLACIYGGISAISRHIPGEELTFLAGKIREYTLTLTVDNRFKKNSLSASVDSSLLWLSVPFKLVLPEDPVMVETINAIENKLLEKGGVKRYPEDSYYGGGQWILLSCWLGWYYTKTGTKEKALEIRDWVEKQADEQGNLPEQVLGIMNYPEQKKYWESRWGKNARPLLWSHAMYLILFRAISEKESDK